MGLPAKIRESHFGNVFAGWVARRTGTPISQLVVGSNSNDILTRWLASGVMEKTGVGRYTRLRFTRYSSRRDAPRKP